ncbi:AMP-binding protein [Salinispira pacifica]|uniref:AMP-binding protein n=1 Tax=Salinispira pacifica TaxID=1307761 RepID=UPI0003F81D93|nr:AMP-binding protein [Salinispira pacifica]
MFKKKLFGKAEIPVGELPIGLGQMFETISSQFKRREAIRYENQVISYQEADGQANRVAGGLESLGIVPGDRVAIMLPNIKEFYYSFFGIQKLGAIAVPFNTMYKGREISHILRDSGAKAVICLSNFAGLIQEIQRDCPDLEHIIVTGQRTFVYVDPGSSVNIQMVFDKTRFSDFDEAYHAVGEILVSSFRSMGVEDAWYSHKGAIRASGKKLATILLSEIENLYIVNIVTFLKDMDNGPLFKVLYIPPELKERALEPMTSILSETGQSISLEDFKAVFLSALSDAFGVDIEDGSLTRDELIAYEKNRALAGRV